MEITVELLRKRIEDFEVQREQLIANVNAVNGAVGILRQLIQDLREIPALDKESEIG